MWIECKSVLYGGACFVLFAQQRESSSKMEMGNGIASVDLEASRYPRDGFGVCTLLQFRSANDIQPSVNAVIARRQS